MPDSVPAVSRHFFLFSMLLALLAVLPFLPGMPGEFLFDDIPNIVNNDSIQLKSLSAENLVRVVATPQISGSMRGLPTLTFALDYWRGGGAYPGIFKATNLLIHALTTFALVWLFRAILLAAGIAGARARWVALVMALAWAVHPLLVSSVLYAVQRLQTLSTLFVVLALLLYMKARCMQIAGSSGRARMLGAVLLWVIAMSCKEDAVAVPAFALALELTVLQFAAANTHLASRITRAYRLIAIVGIALYVLIVIPHYWSWDAYGGREFSTAERLLTQSRVLVMYLWQIVMPLPEHMPFYYDWLEPSRGLLQPWTTLVSLLLIVGLLVLAWHQRHKRALLALGIFLFFSAHFITSNVVGLELAFEHRNHFALVGMVLAIGGALMEVGQRLNLSDRVQWSICCLLLLILGGFTVHRSHSWSSNVLTSQVATRQFLASGRAWTQLCASYFKSGGGAIAANPNLNRAIATCRMGVSVAPRSLNSLTLLVVLRTLRGDPDVRPDWQLLRQRIQAVPMTLDNARIHLILTFHARQGVQLETSELMETLMELAERGAVPPYDLSMIGYFVLNHLELPDQAMPFFISAINGVSPMDPFPQQLAEELRAKGRDDLASKVERHWIVLHGGVLAPADR